MDMSYNIGVNLEQMKKIDFYQKIDFFLIFTKSWTPKMTQNGPKWTKMVHKCAKFHPE